METIAIIILPNTSFIPKGDYDYIGVDKGALLALKEGINCEFCIGDFDSCSEEEKKVIQNNSKEVIILEKRKDDTDSEAAINECIKRGYKEIWLLEGFGGRIDHSIINLRLIYKYPLKVFLIDTQNRVFSLNEGDYEIAKANYEYLSIFALEDTIVSLDKVIYPLSDRKLTCNDLYTISNEIVGDNANISIKEGKVLIIQSNDKKNSN